MKSDDFDALLDGNEFSGWWTQALVDPIAFRLLRLGFLPDQDISLANYTAILDYLFSHNTIDQTRYDALLAEHPDYVPE